MDIKRRVIVTLCAAGICVAAGAAAAWQPADKKPAEPAKPADAGKPADKGAQPAGMPDPDAMMAAYMAAATPGPMHEVLAKNVGTWEGDLTAWMMPGAPPTKSKCTTVITSMVGGRFTKSETKGMMDMGGGQQMPFEGHGIYGYNNTTKKFESTWIDNMGTMMMNSTGTLSPDGKSITWTATFIDPATNKPTTFRNEERFTSDNSMTMEMFCPGPDGKEMKMMQIDYTRKGGKPADKPKDAGGKGGG